MRKLLAFVIGVIGLGMMLSGCVANGWKTTMVKDAYIQKNYIDKVKVPKSKVVGDRNIKFYVGKVKDERKDKEVFVKRTAYYIKTGNTKFANIQKTIRHITEKALYNTGWGVVDNESKANFIVNTTINDFQVHWNPFTMITTLFHSTIDSDICVLNRLTGEKVIKKYNIDSKKTISIVGDLSGKYSFVAGDLSAQYYTALINYFSSPEFVKAIKKAYAEENDDSTKSVGDK